MTHALAVRHGQFGRACLYRMNKALATHAHREGHLTFLVQGVPFRQRIADEVFDGCGVEAVAINPWEPHDLQRVTSQAAAVLFSNSSGLRIRRTYH